MSGENRNANEWKHSLFLLVGLRCFPGIDLFLSLAKLCRHITQRKHCCVFLTPVHFHILHGFIPWRFFLDDHQPQRLVHAGGTSWWSTGGGWRDKTALAGGTRTLTYYLQSQWHGQEHTKPAGSQRTHNCCATVVHEMFSWNCLFKEAAFTLMTHTQKKCLEICMEAFVLQNVTVQFLLVHLCVYKTEMLDQELHGWLGHLCLLGYGQ